jgi:hypothetical protein
MEHVDGVPSMCVEMAWPAATIRSLEGPGHPKLLAGCLSWVPQWWAQIAEPPAWGEQMHGWHFPFLSNLQGYSKAVLLLPAKVVCTAPSHSPSHTARWGKCWLTSLFSLPAQGGCGDLASCGPCGKGAAVAGAVWILRRSIDACCAVQLLPMLC